MVRGPWKHKLSDVNERDGTATCANCGQVKICQNSANGSWVCEPGLRAAQRDYQRKRYKDDPEYRSRNNKASNQWFKENPERHAVHHRRQHLKSRYKWTPEDYDRMFESQGGLCAVCKQPPPDGNRLAVDHDHDCCPGEKTCGKCIRGLLCHKCNRALGILEKHLSTALAYVKNESTTKIIE